MRACVSPLRTGGVVSPLAQAPGAAPRGKRALEASSEQVRRFRLSRHALSRRVPRPQLVRVTGRVGGIQAQLLSAAELALWARVAGLRPNDLDDALWKRRTLVKAWCMRRTLHLLPARELPLFARGTSARADIEIRWVLSHGAGAAELARVLRCAERALDEPLTRRELAERTAEALHQRPRWTRGGGWGNARRMPCVQIGGVRCPADYLLHLLGASSVVCSGPTRDGQATFVRGDAWVRGIRETSREGAEEGLVRRYLSAYGPASVLDYVAWSRVRLRDARPVFERIREELEVVRFDGVDGYARRIDLEDLLGTQEAGGVRLVPYFDAYLLGHRSRGHLLEAHHHDQVYRPQGWVAPALLVDGKVAGTWAYRRRESTLELTVRSFRPLAVDLRRGVEEEADSLARFLGCAGGSAAFHAAR